MALPNSAVPGSAAPTASGWAVPPGPWTEQHLPVAADGHRYEVVDGCLHVTPPPPEPHRAIVEHLLAALASAAPPSWRPVAGTGLRLGESHLAPDAVVLRPGSHPELEWVVPADVALVVEVESPHSRRVDRCLKAGMYAEAGIESYWRIEVQGPVAHLYTRASAGHYLQHRRVHPGQCVTAELPFAVQLAPATWH
jgi:Uma2 family endonuclease